MKATRFSLYVFVIALVCSGVRAQEPLRKLVEFPDPVGPERRFSGGRQAALSDDGTKMIVAFYGSRAQLYDLSKNAPIGEPLGTSGDGEVGFVTNRVAYTADWGSMRLWDTQTGALIGQPIPHELREDTIIDPAISPNGKFIATRNAMKSFALRDVNSHKPIFQSEAGESVVYSLSFSRDNKLLFARSGRSLVVHGTQTGQRVAGPFFNVRSFYYEPRQKIFLTISQADKFESELRFYDTQADQWSETQRTKVSGRFRRLRALDNDRILIQLSNADYTVSMIRMSLSDPATQQAIEPAVTRAFDLELAGDKQYWVTTGIVGVSCQKFGKPQPVWQAGYRGVGHKLRLHQLGNDRILVHLPSEGVTCYALRDGSKLWHLDEARSVSVFGDKVIVCHSSGVQVWQAAKSNDENPL